MQSHFPALRPAKFAAYNLATRTFGLFADPEMRWLARLPAGGVAVDVGSSWGQSIHAIRRYGRFAGIIGFEPNPALARRLMRAFAPDRSVQIIPLALDHSAGETTLHIPRYRKFLYDGLAGIDEDAVRGWFQPHRFARFDPARLSIEAHRVTTARLDDLGLAPAVIKMDVQGAETSVLLGAMETVRAHRPLLIVEKPDAAFVHLAAKAGLAPYGLKTGVLVAGDCTGKNTLFLAPHHLAVFGAS